MINKLAFSIRIRFRLPHPVAYLDPYSTLATAVPDILGLDTEDSFLIPINSLHVIYLCKSVACFNQDSLCAIWVLEVCLSPRFYSHSTIDSLYSLQRI